MTNSSMPFLPKSIGDEEAYSYFTNGHYKERRLPKWPNEGFQRQYTGNCGPSLITRARLFIELIESEGVFINPHWKALDFGCGWGRISSYMLTRGEPSQLDVCDAWSSSISLFRESDAANQCFLCTELLNEKSFTTCYDFIYAFSIFTHLDLISFKNNLNYLMQALRPQGKLFVTVRHADFMDILKPSNAVNDLATNGFWNIVYDGHDHYGETIVTPEFMLNVLSSKVVVKYLGASEAYQHCYCLSSAPE
jgi:2-polyprenyl-3-methyl-5-hydroxy-6-metoxy-1,4-benzoquinol methylase